MCHLRASAAFKTKGSSCRASVLSGPSRCYRSLSSRAAAMFPSKFRNRKESQSTEMDRVSEYSSVKSSIYISAVSLINGEQWVVIDEINNLEDYMEDDIFEILDFTTDEGSVRLVSGITRSTIGMKTCDELRKDHESLLRKLCEPRPFDERDLTDSTNLFVCRSPNIDFKVDIEYITRRKGRTKYMQKIAGSTYLYPLVKKSPVLEFVKAIVTTFRFMFSCTAPPRIQALRSNRGFENSDEIPGEAIRIYVDNLANDKSTVFAQSVENFIACTKDSKETCPHVVMRNIRQFMSGMKNYLVKHGEREFERVVEAERLKLRSNEFLNLDSILEVVLHSRVVSPLRSHVYSLLVDKYYRQGDISLLRKGMQMARVLPTLRLGIRPAVRLPSETELFVISGHFLKMQEADSPIDKLDYLLMAISAIFNAMKLGGKSGGQALGADDFLPVLVHTIAQCSIPGAELEAETMAGLLPPPMLQGEAGYYLTTLFGAVAVLKKIAQHDPSTPEEISSIASTSGGSVGTGGVTKILVPDEAAGALRRIALPWRPGARSRDLCRALAHRNRITNPQDYGLFVLHDGEETLLGDTECPQAIVTNGRYKNCMLAYKRIDAKIAWPKHAFTNL